MSHSTASTRDSFEVVGEIVEAWNWAVANLGALIRVSWFASLVSMVVMFGVIALVVALIAVGSPDFLVDGKTSNADEFIALAMENLWLIVGAYGAVVVIMLFLYAIPVAGATQLALDEKFGSTFGIAYFRFSGPEIRIAVLMALLSVLITGSQLATQFWYFGDAITVWYGVMLDPTAYEPGVLEEYMRTQRIVSGISGLFMLIGTYVYARLFVAIPVILTGGRGLGIRRSLRLTKGYGLIMFGTLLGAYVAMIATIFVSMISIAIAALLVGLAAAMIGTLSTGTSVIVGVVLSLVFAFLIFAWFGFFYGFFQRLQVNAYRWLTARAES